MKNDPISSRIPSSIKMKGIQSRLYTFFNWTNWLGWKQWLLLFTFGVVVIAVEIRNHNLMWQDHNSGQTILTDRMLLGEIFFFGLVLPLISGLVLGYTGRTAIERDKMARALELRRALVAQIHETQNWEDLADLIVNTPGNVVSAERTWLLAKRPGEDAFTQIAHWERPGATSLPVQVHPIVCARCARAASTRENKLIACEHLATENPEAAYTRYCRWLSSQETGKAALLVDVPRARPLNSNQLKVLEDLGDEMSLAVVNANLHYEKQLQVDSVINERQRIARNLHDTLGQNISFLRFKIEQLNSDWVDPGGSDLQGDLTNMLRAADEAYEQVRDTLEELRTAEQKDLGQSVQQYTDQVSQRAGFTASVNISGRPQALSARRNRQIMYILREALNNVEKHAGAGQVAIYLYWSEAEFVMTIRDDGMGFDPTAVDSEERYGLAIMTERSRSINGHLLLKSAPGQGTELIFNIPLASSVATRSGSA